MVSAGILDGSRREPLAPPLNILAARGSRNSGSRGLP